MQGKAVAQYPVPGEKPKYAGSKSGQGWSNRGIVRTSTSEIWAVLETKNPIQKGSCAVQETPLEEFNDYRTVPCPIDLSRTRFCSLPFTPNS